MGKRLDYDQVAPRGAKALGGVYGYVMQSGLPAELVDLVYLRVSQINNCAYCLDMHTRDLVKKGQKIEKLALVQAWAEAGNLFDERERAEFADIGSLTVAATKCRSCDSVRALPVIDSEPRLQFTAFVVHAFFPNFSNDFFSSGYLAAACSIVRPSTAASHHLRSERTPAAGPSG